MCLPIEAASKSHSQSQTRDFEWAIPKCGHPAFAHSSWLTAHHSEGKSMKPEPTTVTVSLTGGKTISFETGKLAKQAHGSAVVRIGENVVLATATSNADPARRHRLLSAHRGLPRIHLRRRTFSRRLHQARRPHERARSAHQPPDRSADPSHVRRRIQVRDAGHRVRAVGR